MSKERTKASIPGILAQVVSDEDLSNLKGDISIPEQTTPDSANVLCVDIQPQKPYRVLAPGDGHMQLTIPGNSIVYLEPLMK